MVTRINPNAEDPIRQYLEVIVSYYPVDISLPEFSGFIQRLKWLDENCSGDYYIPNKLMIHPVVDNNIYFMLQCDAIAYNEIFNKESSTPLYDDSRNCSTNLSEAIAGIRPLDGNLMMSDDEIIAALWPENA